MSDLPTLTFVPREQVNNPNYIRVHEPILGDIGQSDKEKQPTTHTIPSLQQLIPQEIHVHHHRHQEKNTSDTTRDIDPNLIVLWSNPLWNNCYRPVLESIVKRGGYNANVSLSLCAIDPIAFGKEMTAYGEFTLDRTLEFLNAMNHVKNVSTHNEKARKRTTILDCLEAFDNKDLASHTKIWKTWKEQDTKGILVNFLHELYEIIIDKGYIISINTTMNEIDTALPFTPMLIDRLEWWEFAMHKDARELFAEFVANTNSLMGIGNVKSKKITKHEKEVLLQNKKRLYLIFATNVHITNKRRPVGESRIIYPV